MNLIIAIYRINQQRQKFRRFSATVNSDSSQLRYFLKMKENGDDCVEEN